MAAVFPIKAVTVGEMCPSVQRREEKIRPLHKGEQMIHPSAHGGLALSLSVCLSLSFSLPFLGGKSMIPAEKAHFSCLGFGVFSGTH